MVPGGVRLSDAAGELTVAAAWVLETRAGANTEVLVAVDGTVVMVPVGLAAGVLDGLGTCEVIAAVARGDSPVAVATGAGWAVAVTGAIGLAISVAAVAGLASGCSTFGSVVGPDIGGSSFFSCGTFCVGLGGGVGLSTGRVAKCAITPASLGSGKAAINKQMTTARQYMSVPRTQFPAPSARITISHRGATRSPRGWLGLKISARLSS